MCPADPSTYRREHASLANGVAAHERAQDAGYAVHPSWLQGVAAGATDGGRRALPAAPTVVVAHDDAAWARQACVGGGGAWLEGSPLRR